LLRSTATTPLNKRWTCFSLPQESEPASGRGKPGGQRMLSVSTRSQYRVDAKETGETKLKLGTAVSDDKRPARLKEITHRRKCEGGTFRDKPAFEILHGVTFTGLGLLDRKSADENARITQVTAARVHTFLERISPLSNISPGAFGRATSPSTQTI